jgi:SagB-type dehydrogenase family enzyme
MVARADADQALLRALDWQNVESSLSRVRPVSCPVDPMRRYVRASRPFAAPDVGTASRLQELQRVLEWAYGYKSTERPGQRRTRRAPSAGALFPIETFLVVETGAGWQVLYYDYANHAFFATSADGPAVARKLGVASGSAAILCVAVLWRTLQRYGVRGYRYCLLDAAHVAANLARTAQAFHQEAELDPWMAGEELEQLLGLETGEALLLGLHYRRNPASPVAVPPTFAELVPPALLSTENPPVFSPVLQRAVNFHRCTLAPSGTRERTRWPGKPEALDDLYHWASQRCSARDFTATPVSREQYERMAEIVHTRPVFAQSSPALYVYTLTARVEGMAVGLGPVGQEHDSRWALPGNSAATLMRQLTQACQNQAIVAPCAFAFVVATRKSALAALGPSVYRPLVLNAGFLTAELYRQAARFALGTTSIGGFSDEAVSRLVGDPSLTPIVVQIFGNSAQARDKVDMARIVGSPR